MLIASKYWSVRVTTSDGGVTLFHTDDFKPTKSGAIINGLEYIVNRDCVEISVDIDYPMSWLPPLYEDDTEDNKPPVKDEPACECGADIARTTHAYYCPMYKQSGK